jgi:hypothetical protein
MKGLGRVSLGPLLGALAPKLAVVLARIRHWLPAREAWGRGPPVLAGPGVGLRRARTRRARELATALTRLQKGQL